MADGAGNAAESAAEVNPLSLSDEEFGNILPPTADKVEVEDKPEEETAADPAPSKADKAEETAEEPKTEEPAKKPEPQLFIPGVTDVEDKPDPNAAVEKAAVEEEAPNYEEFYKKMMTPFRANGKKIALKDPSEALQLMQMGANYTRKMQELTPHRKVLTMLQNNDLMDEARLSFLIDLDKKNPEAIKKLIKDSGIDPLDIDTSVEPAYYGGNHQVTDEEVSFRTTVNELNSTVEGKETIQIINTTWDQASKELLWKHPETMTIIQSQREIGIYDRIVAEVDRQKTLGTLPPETPFLQAYKIVGDELTEANGFDDLIDARQSNNPSESSPSPKGKDQPKVVATRVAAPKSKVKNDDRASAASTPRTTPSAAKEFINPLAMSDEDFLKQLNGRL